MHGHRLNKGDFNQDAKLDLITNDESGIRTLLIGDGNGRFSTQLPLHGNYTFYTQPVALDLNADGKLDVVSLAQKWNTKSYVSTLLRSGEAWFGSEVQNQIPHPPRVADSTSVQIAGFAVADFNGDTLPDVAVGNNQEWHATVLKSAGNGSFTPLVQIPNLGFAPWYILPGDFNSDGKPDLVLSGGRKGTITTKPMRMAVVLNGAETSPLQRGDLLWKHDSGHFATWMMTDLAVSDAVRLDGLPSLGSSPRAIGLIDVNRDQIPEILLDHPHFGAALAFVKGRKITNVQFVSGILPNQIIGIADLNRDGLGEILTRTGNAIYASFMNGTKVVRQQQIFLTASPWSRENVYSGRFIGAGDFNDDGESDLLWDVGNGILRVDFLKGTTFDQSTTITSQDRAWRAVGVNDFDKNGTADILVEYSDRRMGVWHMYRTRRISTTLLRGGQPVSAGWSLAGSR